MEDLVERARREQYAALVQGQNMWPGRSTSDLLTTGKYRIILIAGRGSHVGARATGTLTLFPTSGLDRSPRYPDERARTDTADHPMYGATDLDLRRVGAALDTRSPLSPSPTSLDPLHPGVLVHFEYPPNGSGTLRIWLSIGSGNVRAMTPYMFVDGATLELSVRRIVDGRAFGAWGSGGSSFVVGGSGEFYIEPFDSDSLDIIERPIAPPHRAAPARPRIPGGESVLSSPAPASRRGQIESASRSRSSRATAPRLTVRR